MKEILAQSPIIPVLNINSVDTAVTVVEMLADCGLTVIELTLRNQNAFSVLRTLTKHFSHMTIGVGTVISTEQLHHAQYFGAQFASSPGFLPSLVNSARMQDFPILPGVATVSEAMVAHDLGVDVLKLYPTEIVGGIPLLKYLHHVLPSLTFCPSGGINNENKTAYLRCPNVISVAMGSLTPNELVKTQNWYALRQNIEQIVGLATTA